MSEQFSPTPRRAWRRMRWQAAKEAFWAGHGPKLIGGELIVTVATVVATAPLAGPGPARVALAAGVGAAAILLVGLLGRELLSASHSLFLRAEREAFDARARADQVSGELADLQSADTVTRADHESRVAEVERELAGAREALDQERANKPRASVAIQPSSAPQPYLRLTNEGAEAAFSVQCQIVGGNTGEVGEDLPVVWYDTGLFGSRTIPGGHHATLILARSELSPGVGFANAEWSTDNDGFGFGSVQSSTGGSMLVPHDPVLVLQLTISARGMDPLRLGYRWDSSGFREDPSA